MDGFRPADMAAPEVARQFQDEPLAAIVYTDIATDGMLAGPNVAAMAEMQAAVELPVVASGGVTTCDDVARLAAAGMAGCIIGRAWYQGTIALPERWPPPGQSEEITVTSRRVGFSPGHPVLWVSAHRDGLRPILPQTTETRTTLNGKNPSLRHS